MKKLRFSTNISLYWLYCENATRYG